jgi:WD40 repeat protein
MHPMPLGARLFRVFLSSTFRDMLAERTALQERVFPRLEAYCRERGGRFQAVDLRWGISEAAGHERQTMTICIEEVRRCLEVSVGVSFVALLGDRYGWLPLPSTVSADDFACVLDALSPGERNTLRAAYRLDENAAPPRQVLAPREPTDARDENTDDVVRDIFSRAVERVFPAGDSRRVDYAASATHIEISEGVFRAPPGRALCYLRRPPSAANDSTQTTTALHALKAELRAFLPADAVHEYALDADSSIEAFAVRVESDLRARIDLALERASAVTAVDRESFAHDEFARRLARNFTGRRELLDRIDSHLTGASTAPLVVVGVGGAGKSSLIGAAYECAKAAMGAACIVARFVGATPEASTVEGLLDALCRAIDHANDVTTSVPTDHEGLKSALMARLEQATPARPLVLFIDALDQLENASSSELLDWLPSDCPAGAKIVASCLDGTRSLDAARLWLAPDAFVAVGPLPAGEAGELLDSWLRDARRSLRQEQRADVLGAFALSPWPLFLRIAFEEARRWRSFDLTTHLEEGIDGLLRQLFARLELAGQHGVRLVRSALRYLGAARHGLTEDELVALLSRDVEVLDEFRARSPNSPAVEGLPLVVWSRLHSDLAAYLSERSAEQTAVLSFYHRSVGETVRAMYLDVEDGTRAHRHIAEYFSSEGQPHSFGQGADGEPNRRKLAELPFQQALGGLHEEGRTTLSDLTFIAAKCRARMTRDLIADFDRHLAAAATANREVALLRRFVMKESANLELFGGIPGFVLQQAHNDSVDGAPLRAWARVLVGFSSNRWLRLANRDDSIELLVATLARHTGSVTDCAFAARAELLVSCGTEGAVHLWNTTDWSHRALVAMLPFDANSCDITEDGSRIVSACEDGHVRIHDRLSGETIACEGKYERSARRCRFMRGEDRILSVGYCGFQIHDARTGRLVRESKDRVLFDCSIGPKALAGIGEANEIGSVLDTTKGVSLREVYIDNLARISSATFSPDGRWFLAAGGTYQKVDDQVPFGASSLWDTKTWEEVDDHEHRYASQVTNALFLSDGKSYAIGFADGSLTLFDTASGARTGGVKGHDGSIRGLARSPDGRHLVTGSFDHQLKVWNTGALSTTRDDESTPSSARFCALSEDGSRGWVWSTFVDRFRCDFTVRAIAWSRDTVEIGDRKPLAWSRELIGLELERRDPLHPMQATAFACHGLPSTPGGRTSPFSGDGEYWLIHASARMWPSEFRLVPALATARQSTANSTWGRSSDGSLAFVLQGRRHWRDEAPRRAAALSVYKGRASKPHITLTWPFDDAREIGFSVLSRDGRAFWFAAGSDIHEALLDQRATSPGFAGDGAPISAFVESPDGAVLVAGREDGTLCTWDARSHRRLAAHDAHNGAVVDCAFVSENELASIGEDGTLRVFRVGELQPRAVFAAGVALRALATHVATRRILTADAQDRVHLLELA